MTNYNNNYNNCPLLTTSIVIYCKSVWDCNKNLVLSNKLIKPNFCFDLPHRRSTTVFLETRNPVWDCAPPPWHYIFW